MQIIPSLRAAPPINATPAYWFSMLAASALGTNIGDFGTDVLKLDGWVSFAVLALASALAIWGDAKFRWKTEAGYWIAIVALRGAATNVADSLTHQMALGYALPSLVLGVATLAAGWFTRLEGNTPRIDGRYWAVMLIAGIFGTVFGDMVSHASGLFAATIAFCLLLLAALVLRARFAPLSLLAYWFIILVERCAGTAVGDGLASRRGLALGLVVALVCTSALLAAGFFARRPARTAPLPTV
jgi:uncharacterized membrane-anchored protein